MRTLFAYLPALACAAMMLFMCIPMMKRMRGGEGSTDSTKEIAELRDEVARLKSVQAADAGDDEHASV